MSEVDDERGRESLLALVERHRANLDAVARFVLDLPPGHELLRLMDALTNGVWHWHAAEDAHVAAFLRVVARHSSQPEEAVRACLAAVASDEAGDLTPGDFT